MQAFAASLIGYWLIKFTPLWGIALMSTCTVFLGPLVYLTNQEAIDAQLGNANQILNDQTVQIRDLAGQHTAQATASLKSYAGDYTAKAQEMLGSATSGRMGNGPTPTKKEPAPPAYSASDFPSAPKEGLSEKTPVKAEPLAA